MPINMLKRIRVKNFKSLEDTDINFSKNSFLIGMNGTGKSTILQAIDFLSALSLGEVEEWLSARGWFKKDLTFYGNKKLIIDIRVEFELEGVTYFWIILFNSQTLKSTKELIIKRTIDSEDRTILGLINGYYSINEAKREKINFNYKGSILSALKSDILGDELNSIQHFFNEIRSAELLSPILMKKRAREAKDGIGLGGEKLSAFLNALSRDKKEILQKELKNFFPHINSFETSSLRSGWKKLSLVENHNNKIIETDSMHLSDGVLRILAILAQLLTTNSILIFDEIEDGINQEFVEKLVDTLVESPHQTLVATHSPLLLNYLEDDIARESILFVYKTKNGGTKVENFFEIIEKYGNISEHEYDLFGAGELMQRVNLLELSDKLSKEENREDSH